MVSVLVIATSTPMVHSTLNMPIQIETILKKTILHSVNFGIMI